MARPHGGQRGHQPHLPAERQGGQVWRVQVQRQQQQRRHQIFRN